MVHPVPGYGITTPYGRRGSYWSCDEDSSGNGIHTGADMAAPAGAQCVAARPGTVAHVSYGSAFGSHQVAVRCSDGTEDFYAHMRSRVPHGQKVDAGQKVGEIGAEGNVTGAHLHFERHRSAGWSCSICVDPAPSINYQPAAGSGGSGAGTGEEMPEYVRVRITKPVKPGADKWHSLSWDVVDNGDDLATKGETHIKVGGKAVTATLSLTVAPAGDGAETFRTRWLERHWNGKEWETTQTWPALEHSRSGGSSYLVDSRTQKVGGDDRRLVCQVNLPEGGQVTEASLDLLAW